MESQELLTISEAARLLDVSAEFIRKWHENGTLVPVVVTPHGWRLYDRAQIEQLRESERKM